jgi:hypothetical protein
MYVLLSSSMYVYFPRMVFDEKKALIYIHL